METPVSRVWRFTPRDGRPANHLTQTGPNATLTLARGDYPEVVFEDARVVAVPGAMVEAVDATVVKAGVGAGAGVGGAQPVSSTGLWVVQALTAPLPDGWRCTAN